MLSLNTNATVTLLLNNRSRLDADSKASQKAIATGLGVADVYDDGATKAVAMRIQSQIGATAAVSERLSMAQGLVTVARVASERLLDQMGHLKEVILKAADTATSETERASYDQEYRQILGDAKAILADASYRDVNILIDLTLDNGTSIPFNPTPGVVNSQDVIVSTDGDTTRIQAFRLDMNWSRLNQESIGSPEAAQQALGVWEEQWTVFASAANKLGATQKSLENRQASLTNQSNAHAAGLGAMVDADLAKESARQQATDLKIQLSNQALSIANQAPQILLRLFQ
ncbi:hypothetical protein JL100_022795 [Skermanella mucosa]|uniref:flagellin n=1 Tax=Skermanella mucosa TaxID=1789672 RepID=UPI00192B19F9|nr:flagellin [Skermanella mucosa]UEM19884.1 hypothetical protein JL100_022795 [Skermanella mucosa]